MFYKTGPVMFEVLDNCKVLCGRQLQRACHAGCHLVWTPGKAEDGAEKPEALEHNKIFTELNSALHGIRNIQQSQYTDREQPSVSAEKR